jgi:hypothetical protein
MYKIQFLLLKEEHTYSDFKEAVVALTLKTSINLAKLYEEK